MRRPTRSGTLAVFGRMFRFHRSADLHHRLLDKGGPARLGSTPFAPLLIRLRFPTPPHGFRFVIPFTIAPEGPAIVLQIVRQVFWIEPSSVRRPRYLCCLSTCRNLPPPSICLLFFPRSQHFLHYPTRVGWAFGFTHHRDDFVVSSSVPPIRASPHPSADRWSPVLNWMFALLSS